MQSLLIEIAILIGLPYLLMSNLPSVLAARPFLMGLGGIYCIFQLFRSRVSLSTLGLTRYRLGAAIRTLLLPSILIVLGIALLLYVANPATRLWLIGSDPLSISNFPARLAFYIFGSAPLQEFIFRGYLTWRLESNQLSPRAIYVLSVGMFTLLHAPFNSPIMLGVSFAIGVLYLVNFLRYRNLLAVSISHALVGAGLILLRNYYLPYN